MESKSLAAGTTRLLLLMKAFEGSVVRGLCSLVKSVLSFLCIEECEGETPVHSSVNV
jgi:hypothetical protein